MVSVRFGCTCNMTNYLTQWGRYRGAGDARAPPKIGIFQGRKGIGHPQNFYHNSLTDLTNQKLIMPHFQISRKRDVNSVHFLLCICLICMNRKSEKDSWINADFHLKFMD